MTYLKEVFSDTTKTVIIIEHDINKKLAFDKVFEFGNMQVMQRSLSE